MVKTQLEKPVLFFDGICGLCNFFIQFVVKRNRGRKLYIATLQGNLAQKILEERERRNLDSLILYIKGKKYKKSDAVLRIFITLGGFWKVAFLGYLIPRFVRNFMYGFVAEIRYQVFGKKTVCRVPTKEEKYYFVD